ncbi:hypothetical protein AVEN_206529-1 [Araneus ventricosus]|uniref:Uncharacterized protein n=1 Tax=Araneus ventricosus TaxID=182803 RepID=A0A4Y2P7D3_ARAVE|nr:hypothetical protein AVEN_206529-1 [Araneus ventricosus]
MVYTFKRLEKVPDKDRESQNVPNWTSSQLSREGFSNQTGDSDSDYEDAILADLKEKWKTVELNGRIRDDATLSDILEVDAELLTASYPTDEEILKSLMDNNKGLENDSYSENEERDTAKTT